MAVRNRNDIAIEPRPILATVGRARPIIYGLADPRDTARVRYVGQTVQCPEARLAGHLDPRLPGRRKFAWFDELAADGVLPCMVLLEEVADVRKLDAREQFWMAELCAIGQADLNSNVRPEIRRIRAWREYATETANAVTVAVVS